MGAVGVPHVLHRTAEADLLGLVHLGDEPGPAPVQPVVGQLDLLAVHDLLLEDAQLVADGVAGEGDVQGGGGVQVAGRQTAQAAVAQTGVGLLLEEVGGGEAQGLNGLGQGLHHPQVVGVLPQGTAHEELHGQVVDLAGVLVPLLVGGFELALGDDVPHHQGTGLEHLLGGGLVHVPAEVPAQLADNQVHQFFFCIFPQKIHSILGVVSWKRFQVEQRRHYIILPPGCQICGGERGQGRRPPSAASFRIAHTGMGLSLAFPGGKAFLWP